MPIRCVTRVVQRDVIAIGAVRPRAVPAHDPRGALVPMTTALGVVVAHDVNQVHASCQVARTNTHVTHAVRKTHGTAEVLRQAVRARTRRATDRGNGCWHLWNQTRKVKVIRIRVQLKALKAAGTVISNECIP